MDPKATSRNTHYFHSFFLRLFTTGCQSFIPRVRVRRVQTQFHDHTINNRRTVACVHVVQKTPHDSRLSRHSRFTPHHPSVIRFNCFQEEERVKKKETTCEKI